MRNIVKGQSVRVYLGESDRKGNVPLYEWLVKKAQQEGIAGATVVRGLMSYGSHHTLHSAKLLDLASHLPIVVELIDSEAKMTPFLEMVAPELNAGLITVQSIDMHVFSKG